MLYKRFPESNEYWNIINRNLLTAVGLMSEMWMVESIFQLLSTLIVRTPKRFTYHSFQYLNIKTYDLLNIII